MGLKGLRSVSKHGATRVTHRPPSAMKGGLVAKAFFPGQPPPLPAVPGRTLFATTGALRLWLCVITGHACTESIAAIVPGKVTRARHADCSERGGCAGTTEHGEGKRGQRAEGDEGIEGARTSEKVWVASCLGEVLCLYTAGNWPISTGLSSHLCGQHLDPYWEISSTMKLRAFLGNLLFP